MKGFIEIGTSNAKLTATDVKDGLTDIFAALEPLNAELQTYGYVTAVLTEADGTKRSTVIDGLRIPIIERQPDET